MKLPVQMRYVDIHADDEKGPNALEVKMGALPEVPQDHVLIRVHAAGINFPDILQRKGLYPSPSGASDILGLEVAGEVVKLGKKVKRWSLRDKVCALTNGGGYAEFVSVPEGQCLPLPKGLDMVEGSSLPEVYFTVWYNVFQLAKLKRTETFLVHGGSGGIGSAAIQLAKAFGSPIYTTCGSEEHCNFARSLGADIAVNYNTEDFTERIKQATHGVDVILDHLGGDYFAKNLDLLKQDGRLVEISALRGRRVELDILALIYKRLQIMGSALRPMTSKEKATIADGLLKNVWPLFEKGDIKPVVTKTFPLTSVAEAHRAMEDSHVGKIVLNING